MAKIAIVGCGAMGSVYAALMVDAGHEVHAVTLWPDHAEAMATKGLRCEGASGPCDLLRICRPSMLVGCLYSRRGVNSVSMMRMRYRKLRWHHRSGRFPSTVANLLPFLMEYRMIVEGAAQALAALGARTPKYAWLLSAAPR